MDSEKLKNNINIALTTLLYLTFRTQQVRIWELGLLVEWSWAKGSSICLYIGRETITARRNVALRSCL
jgi:hypothetical protein